MQFQVMVTQFGTPHRYYSFNHNIIGLSGQFTMDSSDTVHGYFLSAAILILCRNKMTTVLCKTGGFLQIQSVLDTIYTTHKYIGVREVILAYSQALSHLSIIIL